VLFWLVRHNRRTVHFKIRPSSLGDVQLSPQAASNISTNSIQLLNKWHPTSSRNCLQRPHRRRPASPQTASKDGTVLNLKLLLDTIETYVYSIPGLNVEYDAPGRVYVRHGPEASEEWQQYQFPPCRPSMALVTCKKWHPLTASRTAG
jgi:hypothetical protein